MKHTFASVLTIAMFCTSIPFGQSTSAQSLNYNYLEGNVAFYPSYGSGPGSQDFTGWRVRGAIQPIQEVFVFGQFRYLTDDIDFAQAHIGAAFRFEVARRTDLYVGPSIEYVDFSPGPDDFGFGLRGGLRHRINQEFEIGIEARYVNIGGDIDDDYVGVTGTLQYHLTNHFGLIGELDVEDGDIGFLAGARVNF